MQHHKIDGFDRRTRLAKKWQALNTITLNNIGSSPWQIRATLLLMVFMAVFVLAWFMVIHPMYLEIEATQRQQEVLLDEYALKYTQAASLGGKTEQLDKLRTNFSADLAKLSYHVNMTQIMGRIHDAANAAGVTSVDVAMAESVDTPLYTEKPLQITIKGSYHQLTRFLMTLSETPELITVHDFDMLNEAGLGDTPTLQLTMQIKTYEAKEELPDETSQKEVL
ncbi:type 4a pilus biogenesis protein PilO [Moraxella nasovis]|uniref:type 4a pilus biogenesis protein PilO n=1 Tax=Moraxella nasovis TaxID=2904121 RepID=UPI001F6132D2|nr:type 4a pilus biogenesis protein PilO [Moraxella nasovis]UNU72858.1 type 4a pilus biogenesis protein PilO [Moraxella nasovis]